MPPSLVPQHLPMPPSLSPREPHPGTACFHGRLLLRVRLRRAAVTMKDRSKNWKPLQKGRNLSIEAIQAVQALKRARIHGAAAIDATGGRGAGGSPGLDYVMESKVRRLLKRDMMAVLGELQQQNEAFLALQVFEEVRKEHWYMPKLSVYVEMITVLARNGLLEEVELVCTYLKMECLEPDTGGFNTLLRTLLGFGFVNTAMDCFRLMKLWESEPDESTFRILINELESKGEMDISASVRQEAQKYFGISLDFLDEDEEIVCP